MAFSVIATGDVVLNRPLNRPSGKGSIYDHLRTADSCFANLEMPFTKSISGAEKLIPLKADPVHAPIIRDLGIDVVTVANNHGMDYNVQGLLETLEALDDVGVAHVGGGQNITESFAPVVKVVNDTKVAYIGVTTTLPNGSGAGPSRPGLAGVRVLTKYIVDTVAIDESPGMSPFTETVTYKPDEEILLDAIRVAKARADVVLIAIHWGVPYGWVPLSQDEIVGYQQPLAHAMIDAGASAIFGHHPHVVHGVEFYKDAPVFYSLGNLIFSNDIVEPGPEMRNYPAYSWTSLQSRLSNIGALGKVSWSEGKISSCSLLPVTLLEDGEPIEGAVDDAELLLTRLRALSKGRGTEFELKKLAKGFEINITPA
jgi:poly-gamma-glutamate capsule biosynthesis protein CapA/YwtB (metallophosphatase superfamily)